MKIVKFVTCKISLNVWNAILAMYLPMATVCLLQLFKIKQLIILKLKQAKIIILKALIKLIIIIVAHLYPKINQIIILIRIKCLIIIPLLIMLNKFSKTKIILPNFGYLIPC